MTIFNNLPELSDVELYIYNYILTNAQSVTYMSIQKLSKYTNTSTASILRFCRKFGCSGFAEFKFKLREELAKENITIQPEIGNGLHDIINFFQNQATSNEFKTSIQKAAMLLKNKNLILFVGMGSSNIMAEYGALYFSYIFNLSFRIEDLTNYPIDYFPKSLSEKTCIICLSVSGETKEVITYIKNCHTANCSLISITGNRNSKLALLSDVCISYSIPIIMHDQSNLTSQAPAIYILEKIARETENLRNSHFENTAG